MQRDFEISAGSGQIAEVQQRGAQIRIAGGRIGLELGHPNELLYRFLQPAQPEQRGSQVIVSPPGLGVEPDSVKIICQRPF